MFVPRKISKGMKALTADSIFSRSLYSFHEIHVMVRDSVASKGHVGTSIFYWNDFYELQRNTEGLYSYLICRQLHGKVHNFSILGTYFWASIAF